MQSYLGSTGIKLAGVCATCDGDGKLAETMEAAYYPEKYPEDLIPCPDCGGVGGDSPEAAARGRAMSDAYRKALS